MKRRKNNSSKKVSNTNNNIPNTKNLDSRFIVKRSFENFLNGNEEGYSMSINGIQLPFIKNEVEKNILIERLNVSMGGLKSLWNMAFKFKEDKNFVYFIWDRINMSYDKSSLFDIKRLKENEMENEKEYTKYFIKLGIPFFEGKNSFERLLNIMIVSFEYDTILYILKQLILIDRDVLAEFFQIQKENLLTIIENIVGEITKNSLYGRELSERKIKEFMEELFSFMENTDYLYIKNKILVQTKNRFVKNDLIKYFKGSFDIKKYKLSLFFDNNCYPLTKIIERNNNEKELIILSSDIENDFILEEISWSEFLKKNFEERKEILQKLSDYKIEKNINLKTFTSFQKYIGLKLISTERWISVFVLHNVKLPSLFKIKKMAIQYDMMEIEEFRDFLIDMFRNNTFKKYGITISTFTAAYALEFAFRVTKNKKQIEKKNWEEFVNYITKNKDKYLLPDFEKKKKCKPSLAEIVNNSDEDSDDVSSSVSQQKETKLKEEIKKEMENINISEEELSKNILLAIKDFVYNNPLREIINLEYIFSKLILDFNNASIRVLVLNIINTLKINGDFSEYGFNLDKIKNDKKHAWLIKRNRNLISIIENEKSKSSTTSTVKEEEKNEDKEAVEVVSATKTMDRFSFLESVISYNMINENNEREKILSNIRNMINISVPNGEKLKITIKLEAL